MIRIQSSDCSATYALGYIGTEEVIEHLKKLLGDTTKCVEKGKTLGEIAREAIEKIKYKKRKTTY